MGSLEDRIERIALDALKTATRYKGFEKIPEQLVAFRADPVWSHFGIDNEKFLKLRNIGNYYTAIFRKMGDMYEGFVRAIVADRLGLDEASMKLSFQVLVDNKKKKRTLDAQIDFSKIGAADTRRIRAAIDGYRHAGHSKLGFEVRCCYQIGDSKRIQADEVAAGYLSSNGYIPVLMIFCTTSLKDPVRRLRGSWNVTEGMESYDLLRKITGFDLHAHLERLRPKLKGGMREVMKVFQIPKL